MKKLLHLTILLSTLGCVATSNDENDEKTQIRETGYLRCEISEYDCPGDLACEAVGGEIDCIEINPSCKDNFCDCFGDQICSDRTKCYESESVNGFICRQNSIETPPQENEGAEEEINLSERPEEWTDISNVEIIPLDPNRALWIPGQSIRGPWRSERMISDCEERVGGSMSVSNGSIISIYNQSSEHITISNIELSENISSKWSILNDVLMPISFPIEIPPYQYADGFSSYTLFQICGLFSDSDFGEVIFYSPNAHQPILKLPFIASYYGPWSEIRHNAEIKTLDQANAWNDLGVISRIEIRSDVPLTITGLTIIPNNNSSAEWRIKNPPRLPFDVIQLENTINGLDIQVEVNPYHPGLHSAVLEIRTNDPLAPVTHIKVNAELKPQ